MGASVFEQARIQAQLPVPLAKAFQAELGEQRADAIARQALGEACRRIGERGWRERRSDHVAEGLGSGVELRRTQTLMQGAAGCDFRYRGRGGDA